ncbi:hypothetical protein DY000_02053911 [Brassica cretica]|uniref:Uncharacterized protein n=1 Tax=Brassica cretica TaxID=69181 RepID=A0ABQ7A4V0_BRACR|nr:hypothetical protein DY000_02053911 [Brassica cretica]
MRRGEWNELAVMNPAETMNLRSEEAVVWIWQKLGSWCGGGAKHEEDRGGG